MLGLSAFADPHAFLSLHLTGLLSQIEHLAWILVTWLIGLIFAFDNATGLLVGRLHFRDHLQYSEERIGEA